jgi:hypothetical protein
MSGSIHHLRSNRSADAPTQTQEKVMRQKLRAGTFVLALFSSVGLTAAQNAPDSSNAKEKLDLSQSQEQKVTEGLRGESSQSAPGYRGQVGSNLPDSMTAKPLPDDVTAQVPETKTYLFVKLPDRILLIDPENKLVAEIVGGPVTTGTPSSANPDSHSPPPR